ncbi:MAG: YdcF family protein [Chloroflexi bacterium]|nr:YdcF family protein [Chloroflexota bacterium]
MFILLSKFLPLLVYPLGLSLLLLLIALFFIGKKKNLKWLIALILLLLWAASTAPVANAFARSLEWQYRPLTDIPTADAIVVLGGGTEPAIPPRRSVEINSAGDRVFAAARLYREGKAPVLILSGGNIDWLSNNASTPADQMADMLSFLGVPSSALILENTSQNTYENALHTKAIMEEKGFDQVLLVTSAIHMPRSVSLFEKQGVSVIPVPVDYSVVENTTAPSTLDIILGLLPSAGNLSTTTNALKEYLGIWMYTLQGWI